LGILQPVWPGYGPVSGFKRSRRSTLSIFRSRTVLTSGHGLGLDSYRIYYSGTRDTTDIHGPVYLGGFCRARRHTDINGSVYLAAGGIRSPISETGGRLSGGKNTMPGSGLPRWDLFPDGTPGGGTRPTPYRLPRTEPHHPPITLNGEARCFPGGSPQLGTYARGGLQSKTEFNILLCILSGSILTRATLANPDFRPAALPSQLPPRRCASFCRPGGPLRLPAARPPLAWLPCFCWAGAGDGFFGRPTLVVGRTAHSTKWASTGVWALPPARSHFDYFRCRLISASAALRPGSPYDHLSRDTGG